MNDMRPYPVPANETARARTVAQMDLKTLQGDPFFTHVTDMVKALFDVPVAFVSLFTEENQDFLACQGLDITGTPRTHSLCAFTVAARKTIVIPDALQDQRSFLHPVVVQMGLRFSASAPVILRNGFCMGTVCGVDLQPHEMPSDAQIAQLNALAGMIARFYEAPREPDPEHLERLMAIATDAQSEFLALIGHELRTPLNGIHGMAQVLEAPSDEDTEIVETILKCTEHLHDIIGSVLAFTEFSNGDIQLDEGRLNVGQALENARRAHIKLAQMQGKSVTLGVYPEDLDIQVDAAKMELALSCLVNNCVAHGGANVSGAPPPHFRADV